MNNSPKNGRGNHQLPGVGVAVGAGSTVAAAGIVGVAVAGTGVKVGVSTGVSVGVAVAKDVAVTVGVSVGVGV